MLPDVDARCVSISWGQHFGREPIMPEERKGPGDKLDRLVESLLAFRFRVHIHRPQHLRITFAKI